MIMVSPKPPHVRTRLEVLLSCGSSVANRSCVLKETKGGCADLSSATPPLSSSPDSVCNLLLEKQATEIMQFSRMHYMLPTTCPNSYDKIHTTMTINFVSLSRILAKMDKTNSMTIYVTHRYRIRTGRELLEKHIKLLAGDPVRMDRTL
ncbi:unnamed protein product [Victoria cruziana]